MPDKTDNIKTRLQFEGEKEYKDNCAQIGQNLKVLSSELRATTAQYASNGNGVDALRAKQDILKKTYDEQKKKVEETEKAYKAMVDAQGENSAGAKRMETALNNAKTSMYNTENQVKSLDEQLKNAGKSSSDFGEKLKSGLSKVGSGVATGVKAAGAALVGMGAAAVGAAAGAGKMVMSSVSAADELQRLSDVTGLSAEKIQIMKYQGSALGVEFDTMAGAQAKLTKAMSAAQGGTGAQAKAFQQLGVSVKDSSGHLRNSNDVFNDAITKLGGVQNSTERDALAMQIFGKSAMQLNPLIKAGGDQLAAMSDEAKKTGAVMSDEAVAGLDNFGDSLDAAKLAAKGMAGTLASSALPMLNQFTGLLGNLSASLNSALSTGDFSQFGTVLADGISSMVGQISGMVEKAVPVVSKVISSIIGALAQAIPAILPALTAGVLLLLNSAIQILQSNGPALVNAGITAIITLVNGLVQALPQLTTAAITMIMALVDGFTKQLPSLIPMAVKANLTIVNGIIDNLPKIINAAIDIILALIEGIMNALPQLIAEVPRIIMGIINGLVGALPRLISMAPRIIVSVIMGLIKAIPQLITYAPQIISAIISGLIQAVPQLLSMGPKMLNELASGLRNQDWGSIGKNIIRGIVDGFKTAGSWISQGVRNVANSITSGFKNFFGIHSPSTLMRDQIGTNLGLGIQKGMEDTDFMATVPNMVNRAKGKINSALRGNFNVSASAIPSSGTLQFILPVYVNGQLTETKTIGVTSEQLARAQSGQQVALGV